MNFHADRGKMGGMETHQNNGVQKRLILSIGLTLIIFFAELFGGLWTGSLALLSDAAHMFMDVFALVLSASALWLSSRPADDGHTYGYHRFEVLAALVNGISLAAIAIGIFIEAIDRFQSELVIRSGEMLIIAAIGLAVNLVVAFVLNGHDHDHGHENDHDHEHISATSGKDLNLNSAFLHVIGDAISSVGVIVAAIIVGLTGLNWVDPLVSVLIGVMISLSAVRVLRSALHILVEGTPVGMSQKTVNASITGTDGVLEVHDLHVWSICSGNIALSAHVVVAPDAEGGVSGTLKRIQDRLHDAFGIHHTTIQVEEDCCGQCESCSANITAEFTQK